MSASNIKTGRSLSGDEARYQPLISHSDAEENASNLQKSVVNAAKEITDVVASFEGWMEGSGPLLQQSVDFLREVSHDSLAHHGSINHSQ